MSLQTLIGKTVKEIKDEWGGTKAIIVFNDDTTLTIEEFGWCDGIIFEVE